MGLFQVELVVPISVVRQEMSVMKLLLEFVQEKHRSGNDLDGKVRRRLYELAGDMLLTCFVHPNRYRYQPYPVALLPIRDEEACNVDLVLDNIRRFDEVTAKNAAADTELAALTVEEGVPEALARDIYAGLGSLVFRMKCLQ